ncbi:MAG: 3-phosphoshikimate 1-carboxyvinyltransferase [Synergistaceae bacterium]|nr:3-phosphoshikimate 1-carboxyvinyltransferase [Synergistota bacterium]NLM70373.1 3-phosphoshikimate 1-carboxyvinyltransferase [Synergistaceae bacterium]
MKRIEPAKRIHGRLSLPGDKSISHRAALLGAVCPEGITVRNFSDGADCSATLSCLEQAGASVRLGGGALSVSAPAGLTSPGGALDAGNSGTTARTLCGLIAGLPGVKARITGDDSLSKRPMMRVVSPLRAMGASIGGPSDGLRLPVEIRGERLKGTSHVMETASAQVKTAILLAGLGADEPVTVIEPLPTRDHTERMLAHMGAALYLDGGAITISPSRPLKGGEWTIPGDFSSAAFWIVAAAILPDSCVSLPGTGLNPTRTGLLSVLERMGLACTVEQEGLKGGEPAGTITVHSSRLRATEIEPSEIPLMIDELPVLAVAATQAEGTTELHGAMELRFKECDRIVAMVRGLSALGADITELEDGWRITGPVKLKGGRVSSMGDHRVAMALAVAGLAADSPVEIMDHQCVDISYPGFFKTLDMLAGRRN